MLEVKLIVVHDNNKRISILINTIQYFISFFLNFEITQARTVFVPSLPVLIPDVVRSSAVQSES